MFFQDRHSSEFVARLAFAANGVRDTLQLVVQSGARDLLTVAGLAAVMIYRDPARRRRRVCALPIAALLSSAGSSPGARNSPSAPSKVRPRSCRRWARRCSARASSRRSISRARCASAWRASMRTRRGFGQPHRGGQRPDRPCWPTRSPACAIGFAIYLRLVAGQRAARRRRLVRLLPRRAAARLRAGQAAWPASRSTSRTASSARA